VKVVLSGDGGDELFGGYHSFFEVEKLAAWDAIPQLARRAIGFAGDLLPYSAYGKNFLRSISRPHPLERYFEYISFNSYYLRTQVLNPEWVLPAGVQFLRTAFDGSLLSDEHSSLSQAMYFEATAKLTGDILTKVDRMSMATSLEVRCPLLDHRLAEFANTIPNHWKTRGGKGKLILLEALADYLPPELLNRPKKGFSVPLRSWLRGPLRDFLHDHLTSQRFLNRGFVAPRKLEAMLNEHWTGRRDNSNFLWLLLVLELWYVEQHSVVERDRGFSQAAVSICDQN
jgi:asparagine synthase (glutamine-hydrolysing)